MVYFGPYFQQGGQQVAASASIIEQALETVEHKVDAETVNIGLPDEQTAGDGLHGSAVAIDNA